MSIAPWSRSWRPPVPGPSWAGRERRRMVRSPPLFSGHQPRRSGLAAHKFDRTARPHGDGRSAGSSAQAGRRRRAPGRRSEGDGDREPDCSDAGIPSFQAPLPFRFVVDAGSLVPRPRAGIVKRTRFADSTGILLRCEATLMRKYLSGDNEKSKKRETFGSRHHCLGHDDPILGSGGSFRFAFACRARHRLDVRHHARHDLCRVAGSQHRAFVGSSRPKLCPICGIVELELAAFSKPFLLQTLNKGVLRRCTPGPDRVRSSLPGISRELPVGLALERGVGSARHFCLSVCYMLNIGDIYLLNFLKFYRYCGKLIE